MCKALVPQKPANLYCTIKSGTVSVLDKLCSCSRLGSSSRTVTMEAEFGSRVQPELDFDGVSLHRNRLKAWFQLLKISKDKDMLMLEWLWSCALSLKKSGPAALGHPITVDLGTPRLAVSLGWDQPRGRATVSFCSVHLQLHCTIMTW